MLRHLLCSNPPPPHFSRSPSCSIITPRRGGHLRTRAAATLTAYPARITPTAQVAEFVSCVRHIMRVIWAVHLALAEGFEEDIVKHLKKRSAHYSCPEWQGGVSLPLSYCFWQVFLS